MATRRRIFDYSYFNSNNHVTDGLFSLQTTIENDGLKLSVMKLHVSNCEHVESRNELLTVQKAEFLELTKDLFDILIKQRGEGYVSSAMDPFLRLKFRNSIIYKLLYFGDGITGRSAPSNEAAILWNLYCNDVKVLEYLVYLFGGEDISLDMFYSVCARIPKCKNGCSPRNKLGFSKNKARVIKACRYPELLMYPNYVFDDDVDLLLDFFKIKNTYSVLHILKIKEANPSLKYEYIIRKAVVFTIDSQQEYCSFHSAIDEFIELLKYYKCFKEDGFDRPFKLCKSEIIYEDYNDNSQEALSFTVENARVYKIHTANELAYANAISEAFSRDALAQVLSRNNKLCLIVKRGRYYIAEVHDGYVVNIYSKYDASGLQIIY